MTWHCPHCVIHLTTFLISFTTCNIISNFLNSSKAYSSLLQYFITWYSFIQEGTFLKFFPHFSLAHWMATSMLPLLVNHWSLHCHVHENLTFWCSGTITLYFPLSTHQLHHMLMGLKFGGICLLLYSLVFVLTTVMTEKKIYFCAFHLHWKLNP